ncbi:hypothetical protein, partial [Lactiplantibacillus plantarum]|uniref:hypothetical protein n=1 Tax=Lactiplantibacillus plantarum TaxID=1590 RepID=UPI003459C561
RRVSGATDALFLFSIISKTGLEKSEDFSRPVLFLETYVTASGNLNPTMVSTIVEKALILLS